MRALSNILIFYPFALSLSKGERIKNTLHIQPFILRQAQEERLDGVAIASGV
jgi:hypothetical protein